MGANKDAECHMQSQIPKELIASEQKQIITDDSHRSASLLHHVVDPLEFVAGSAHCAGLAS